MTEFVVVLPFFAFFLFLLISFGVMLSFRQELSQAATEGARAAAVAPLGTSTSARIQRAYDAVDEALEAQGGVSCSGGTLSDAGGTVGTCSATIGPCPNNGSQQCVTVVLIHNYDDHPVVDVPRFLGFTNPDQLRYSASARVS